jgi:Fungalysin metallopeptidase (M36)/FG-GAP-like repeat
MKYSSLFRKFGFPLFVLIVLVAVIFWLGSPPKILSAKQEMSGETLLNYDIRTDENAKQRLADFTSGSRTDSERQQAKRAAENLSSQIPNLKVEYNEDLRIPEVISPDFSRGTNFITQPSNKKRADILRQFINRNSELVGLNATQINQLEKVADYTNPDGNLSFVEFEQKINSIPVFRGEIKAGFTKKNEIIRIINNLAPSLDYQTISKNFGRAEQAVLNAAKHLNLQANESDTKQIDANHLKITFERGQFDDKTTAEKMYFPIDYGVARAAWRVLIWTKTSGYYVIVDAENGTVLWSKNITESQTQSATYNVYWEPGSLLNSEESPAAIGPVFCQTPITCTQPPMRSRILITGIGNEGPFNFNQLGWLTDGENRTIGNNVEVGIDRDGTQGIDPNGWAFGNPTRVFNFAYNPAPGSPAPGDVPVPTTQTYPPSPFQQGAVTSAFYVVNRWHDQMYLLGFNELSRNFQNNNFGIGGLGGDSILVETQDSSGTNSANLSTPADGGRPRLQLFIWTGTTPNRDGSLDNQILVHELTHGVSNRLHGNASGLNTNMARGMGEGWSDFYSLALLAQSNDNPLEVFSLGCYSISGIANCYYGLRRFPIAQKAALGANGLPHNPLTFRYINSGCSLLIGTPTSNPNSAFPVNPLVASGNCDQIHNIGEIWSSALWEMRGRLLLAHRTNNEGNKRALKYVTDGMKLSPLNPTILQSRDSIVAATQASAPSDACAVWKGFAIRGMGFSASIQNIGTGANNTSVTEAFDLPLQCVRRKRADFDGDGKSDISVYRPSEGNWYLNRSTAGFSAMHWGISTDRIVPADYDGDGKTDFAIFRPSVDSNQPDFYILNSSNFTFTGVYWGNPNDIPVIEDYDGDGKADIAIVRPTSGNYLWYLLKSSNGQSQVSFNLSFLPSTAQPIGGDFDGDGKADLIAVNFEFGEYYWYSFTSTMIGGFSRLPLGTAGDKIALGDYNGDGVDDMAVYRPSNGIWYIRNSSGNSAIQFGIASDIPVPADYDGDGRTDIAIYRNGTWWITQSTAGLTVTQFGLSNDIPIISGYLP